MDSKSTLLASLKTWWNTTLKNSKTVETLIGDNIIIDGYTFTIVYDRDAISLVAQKGTSSIIIFNEHSLNNEQQFIAFLITELNKLNGGKKRKTRRNNRNARRTLIRRKMTGGNPPKSASSVEQNRQIRYYIYSLDSKDEFIITYYGPVNTAQNPHGIGQLYVGPTLHQNEVFKGNFDNGVVNDTNGKTTRSGTTLFGWGYIDASIANGNIINHGNNENLKEFKNKNIILDFTDKKQEWNDIY
jgi:hypothetical protein